MHPVLVCVLITYVFAVMENGHIGTGLPVARKSISHPLPVENKKTLNPGQNLQKYDSRRNVTDLILDHTTAPKSGSLAALQRQFQEAKKSTRVPASRTMYLRSRATYLKRTNRNISSNQLATAVPPKFVDSLPKLLDGISETEPRKEPVKLSRKIANVDSTNSVEISNKTHRQFVTKFPTDFRYLLSTADESEKALLSADANNASDRNSIETHLADYKQAKRNKRRMLQSLDKNSEPEADEIVAKYKALRKGVDWTHVKLRQFFDTPSARLKEYETVRKDERNFKYDYLDGTTHYPKKKSDGMRLRKRFNLPVRLSTFLLPKSTTPASNGNESKNIPDAKRNKRDAGDIDAEKRRKDAEDVKKIQDILAQYNEDKMAMRHATFLDESTTSSTTPPNTTRKWILVSCVGVGVIIIIIILIVCLVYCIKGCRKSNKSRNNPGDEKIPLRSRLKFLSTGAMAAKSFPPKTSETVRK